MAVLMIMMVLMVMIMLVAVLLLMVVMVFMAVEVLHVIIVIVLLQHHPEVAHIQSGLADPADFRAEAPEGQGGQHPLQRPPVRPQVQQRRHGHIAADAGAALKINCFAHISILPPCRVCVHGYVCAIRSIWAAR